MLNWGGYVSDLTWKNQSSAQVFQSFAQVFASNAQVFWKRGVKISKNSEK